MEQMTIYDFPEYLPDHKKEVDVRGICDDGYCPDCNSPLDDLIPECPECGLKLDWSLWKRLNEEEDY